MESKYKVGDKVRIRLDLEDTACDHPFIVVDYMLRKHGHICTIERVIELPKSQVIDILHKRFYTEPFAYHLEEMGDYYWSESMFEDVSHPCFLVKEHDNIIFTTPQGGELFYSVQFNFLTNRKSFNNEVIFEELGIRDRYAFCSRAYGYQTIEGMFPACKEGDYEALTRVILALGRYCREVSLNGNTIITNTVAQICRNRVQEFYNIESIESTASSTEEKKKLQLDFASPECILHINKKQYKF